MVRCLLFISRGCDIAAYVQQQTHAAFFCAFRIFELMNNFVLSDQQALIIEQRCWCVIKLVAAYTHTSLVYY
jgi:hypothetical protein